jgi:dinuclear metal center YbgI/SA1388 family protein
MKMITLQELTTWLQKKLNLNAYKDYAPNGLQVSGKERINTLVTGVTASQALIDAAIEKKADCLLVHHGYFWKGEDPCVVGIKYQRLKSLMEHGISLLGYHLPLDGHEEFGNNVQLAKLLGFKVRGEFDTGMGPNVGLTGELSAPMTVESLCAHLEKNLNRAPLYLPGNDRLIKTVAWCTGGGQDFIAAAALAGVDAYLTGECSERTTHIARESEVHFFGCGHHATERYGVKSLGEHLANKFSLAHHFIDIDNPI